MGFRKIAILTAVVIIFHSASSVRGAEPIELDGFIEPYEVANVGTGVSGIIDSIEADRGDLVKKGKVLARLDIRVEQSTVNLIKARSEMEASVSLRRTRVEFANREYGRRKELFEKGIIPDYDMDEAETNLELAKQELQEIEEQMHITRLELKQAQAALARKIIRSPINGVVVERYLSPGELTSDKPLFKLAQLDPLTVEVIAPVELLGSVKEGQEVEISPERPLNRKFRGEVKIVDRVVDAASGTFGIRIELSNKDLSLPAGLKCRVRFLN
jgi:RND family efflux transporter MFP subunit